MYVLSAWVRILVSFFPEIWSFQLKIKPLGFELLTWPENLQVNSRFEPKRKTGIAIFQRILKIYWLTLIWFLLERVKFLCKELESHKNQHEEINFRKANNKGRSEVKALRSFVNKIKWCLSRAGGLMTYVR